MRVLVCGGRNYDNYDIVSETLSKFTVDAVITGGCSGADALAERWARENNVAVLLFPAQWDEHGRAAGPIRNQQMLDEGKPDLVLAFRGGKGTADMVRRAAKANIRILLRND